MKTLSNSTSRLISNRVDISVPKLLELFNEISSIVIQSDLILVIAKNNLSTVGIYLLADKYNTPVIIIDNNIPSNGKEEIIDKYCPSTIISTENLDLGRQSDFQIELKGLSEELYIWCKDERIEIFPELSVLLSTSGSTGSPKLVRLSRNNIYSNAYSILEYLPVDKDDTCLLNLPLSYSYGLSILNTHLLSNSSIYITGESFLSKELWSRLEQYGVNSLAGVPEMIKMLRLMKIQNKSKLLAKLKYVTQAGGNLDIDNRVYFYRLFNSHGIKFFIMYGQTEATARMSYLLPMHFAHKSKSVGIPISSGKFRVILEDKSNNDVEGEIVYEGPNVMLGYAESAADLKKGDELKGILHTGDLGYIDDDGFLFITGRKKRIVKINGNRFSLDHLEEMIMSMGINVAAISEQDKITVFIIDSKNKPKVINIFEELNIGKLYYNLITLDNLPINNNGKVDYNLLKNS